MRKKKNVIQYVYIFLKKLYEFDDVTTLNLVRSAILMI